MNDTEDRRVRRSRKMLKQGLLELMHRKKFSEISVRDITDRMDMNRGTFYLHYSGTVELLRSIENDLEAEAQALVDAHIRETEQSGSMKPVFEPILDFIIANRETCAILFDNNEVSGFFDRIQEVCSRNGRSIILARCSSVDESRLSYLLNFVSYGLMGILKTWFAEGMAMPKEELLHMADRLLESTVNQML